MCTGANLAHTEVCFGGIDALHAHGWICEQGELLGILGGLSHSEVNTELLRALSLAKYVGGSSPPRKPQEWQKIFRLQSDKKCMERTIGYNLN